MFGKDSVRAGPGNATERIHHKHSAALIVYRPHGTRLSLSKHVSRMGSIRKRAGHYRICALERFAVSQAGQFVVSVGVHDLYIIDRSGS